MSGFTPDVGLAENWAIGAGTEVVGGVSGVVRIVTGVVTTGVAIVAVVIIVVETGVGVAVGVVGPDGRVVQPASATPSSMQANTITAGNFIVSPAGYDA